MASETSTKISVVIITKNEADHIENCLNACLGFTDDMIVVDSGSTDQTVALAESLGARVYKQEWLGYGPQKNFGNQQSKYDWILSLDADERPNQELIHFLKSAQLKNGHIYQMKLIDHFADRKIKYSELRPKWKKRLYNRNEVKWNRNVVHELLEIPKEIKILKISGKILHYSYNNIDDFRNKILYYAQLGAQQMHKEGIRPSVFKKYFNPYFRFFRSYIMYGGFLEGKLGFQISNILKKGLMYKYQTLKSINK